MPSKDPAGYPPAEAAGEAGEPAVVLHLSGVMVGLGAVEGLTRANTRVANSATILPVAGPGAPNTAWVRRGHAPMRVSVKLLRASLSLERSPCGDGEGRRSYLRNRTPRDVSREENDKLVRLDGRHLICRPPGQRHLADDKFGENLHLFVCCRFSRYLSLSRSGVIELSFSRLSDI